MNNKNISFNHTLEEYNKKYRNRKYRLLKFTKKEVEDFDKKNSTGIKNYLLKDRKWWLIKDTYYEIPIAPRATWFRNLSAGAQVATCVLGAGVLATAVVVPTVLLLNKDGTVNREVSVDEAIEHVKCESKMVDGNLEITLKPDTGYKVTGIKEIKINTYKLQDNEYKYENSKVTIAKEVLSAHTGKVIVTPNYEKDEPVVEGELVVSAMPTKWIYVVGEKFSREGLKINLVKGSTTTDVTNDCVLTGIDETKPFEDSDVADEKEVTATYKGKSVKFNIAVNKPFNEYLELSGSGGVKPISGVKLPKHLLIPEKLNDTQIDYVAYGAFENNEDIITLDLSFSKITKIVGLAFNNCKNLKKVKLASTITNIGGSMPGDEGSFNNCSSLQEIHILSKYSHDDDGEFDSCSSLEKVIIDSESFANLKENEKDFDSTLYAHATTVYIKSNISLSADSYIYKNYEKASSSDREGYDKYVATEYIYSDFEESPTKTCSIAAGKGFKGGVVKLPSKKGEYDITSTAMSSFMMKKNVSKVIFPDSYKEIKTYSFLGCSLTEVEFGKNIETICSDTFTGTSLKGKIVLNDGLITIGTSAFATCKGITEINIPSSVTTLDNQAFDGCTSLKTIVVDNQKFASITADDSCLYQNATTIFIKDGLTLPSTGTYIYENFAKKITSSKAGYSEWVSDQFSFNELSPTTCSIGGKDDIIYNDQLTLPSKNSSGQTVVEISSSGFYGCNSLNKVVLSANITEIGGLAFDSSSLVQIELNDGLNKIGGSAFSNCGNLKEINIPSSLSTSGLDGDDIFYNCPQLNTIVIDNQSFVDTTTDPKDLYSKANTVYIKNGLTAPSAGSYIGDNFIKQDNSDRPGYDEYILNKYNFTTISGSNNVSISGIKDYKYYETETLPDNDGKGHSVTEITYQGFAGNNKITNIILSQYINKINGFGFAGSSLKTIKLNDGLNEIGGSAFEGCESLIEVNIPSSLPVTGLTGSGEVFSYCSSLTTVVLDNQTFVDAATDIDVKGLFNNAKTIYIKKELTDPTSGFIFSNFTKQGTSDRDGYSKWTKNG